MSQVVLPVWKRSSFDRWSPEETGVLISAWAPLYRRRRSGTKDAWVPLHIRGRACSSRSLVTEDWRAVAFAVNSYRAITAGLDSCRTHLQCKKRLEYLRTQYVKGLAPHLGWPFFGALHAVWADELGDRGAAAAEGRGAGAPAGDDAGGTAAAAGAFGGAAADDEGGSAAGNADSGTAAAAAGHASRGSAMQMRDGAVVIEGAAAAGHAGGTASVEARGGALVHEDCHAAAVVVTSDGISSEGTHTQCRRRVKLLSCICEKKKKKDDAVSGAAAVGEERGGVGDDASGGASVDGLGSAAEAAATRRAAFEPPPIPKRQRSGPQAKPAASSANKAEDDGKKARVGVPPEAATAPDLSAQAMAAGFVDAAVLAKLAEIYKELRMKALDVEREKAAAAHAGAAGRRA